MKNLKPLRAIVIDAKKHEVREEHFNRPSLPYLQGVVGGLIELVPGPEGADLFVDEEGGLKSPKDFFFIAGAYTAYAGNGVIVGHNRAGETIDAPAKYTAKSVLEIVKFHTRS